MQIFLASRILGGCFAFTMPVMSAYIADSEPDIRKRVQLMSKIGPVGVAGAICGPLTASAFSGLHIQTPYLFLGCMAMIGVFPATAFLPRPQALDATQGGADDEANHIGTRCSIVKYSKACRINLMFAILAGGVQASIQQLECHLWPAWRKEGRRGAGENGRWRMKGDEVRRGGATLRPPHAERRRTEMRRGNSHRARPRAELGP